MPPRADLKPAKPLTREERHQITAVLRRLKSEVRGALGHLPKDIQGPSAVARHLDIDKATAHRVIRLSTIRPDEPGELEQAPGDQGLRRFARACRRAGMDAGVVAAVDSAAEQFGRVIRELAGSKTRLMGRVRASGPPEGSKRPPVNGAEELRRREALYRAACEMIGRSTEVRVDLMIFRPSAAKSGWMDHTWVRGVFGHFSRTNTSPIPFGYSAQTDRGGDIPVGSLYQTLDADEMIGHMPRAILAEFSTQPLPIVTSKGRDNRATLLIDSDAPGATERGVDLVVAQHRDAIGKDPSSEYPPLLELNAMIREPARTLIFDVYLHREMARRAIPQLDLYLWSLGLGSTMVDHWFDALETSTPLQLLGPGVRKAASQSFDRQEELTRTVFVKRGYDAEEYVGFRCEVSYPMWGGAYGMSFDFGGPKSDD